MKLSQDRGLIFCSQRRYWHIHRTFKSHV